MVWSRSMADLVAARWAMKSRAGMDFQFSGGSWGLEFMELFSGSGKLDK